MPVTAGRAVRLLAAALTALTALGGAPVAHADDGELLQNSPWCVNGVAGPIVPGADQVLLGELLDWSADTPRTPRAVASSAGSRLGRAPAVYTVDVPFPFPDDGGATAGFLNTVADDVSHVGGILDVTLNLGQGLSPAVVTTDAADALAGQLRAYNTVEGVPVLVRIGPEMNGSWNVWGQQPQRFVAAFQTVADAIHALDPATQTVWAPNYGGGAPWSAGAYAARRGTADFAALDTNHDGTVDAQDDPYAPYWPGARYVDWVGLSLYDFGATYPFGPNTLPQPHQVLSDLQGTYKDAYTDQSALPDFSQAYSTTYGKPLMLAETGIWFSSDDVTTANSELAVKNAWWQQLSEAEAALPELKAVMFFDITKPEVADALADPPKTDVVQWPIDDSAGIAAAFMTQSAQYVFATGHACLQPPPLPPVAGAPPAAYAPPAPALPPRAAAHPRLVLRCTVHNDRVIVRGHRVLRARRTCARVPAPVRRCSTVTRTIRLNGHPVARRVRTCTVFWPPAKPPAPGRA